MTVGVARMSWDPSCRWGTWLCSFLPAAILPTAVSSPPQEGGREPTAASEEGAAVEPWIASLSITHTHTHTHTHTLTSWFEAPKSTLYHFKIWLGWTWISHKYRNTITLISHDHHMIITWSSSPLSSPGPLDTCLHPKLIPLPNPALHQGAERERNVITQVGVANDSGRS